jgi:xanthine dehydrogenase accessory factor
MKDILNDLDRWVNAGQPVAIGTIIQTWGSAPRGVGSKMGVSAGGEISGSVSGGCVEGAVVEASLEVLSTGVPQLLHFGVADETAWEVGLACGGTIEVFVNQLDLAWYSPLDKAIQQEKSVAAATIIKGAREKLGRTIVVGEDGSTHGTLGEGLDEVVLEAARKTLAAGEPRRQTIFPAQERKEIDIFIDVILPSPVLVIVGGAHISIALAELARVVGFRTIIIDPRRSFGNQARFPNVDRLLQAWPDQALSEIEINRSTAVATLTHDPKLDDPALAAALRSQAFYVGALGSQKTQASRRQRLLEAGLSEGQLERLHGPIGLDIEARTPEEIALSIMAEIVAARRAAQSL